MAFWYTLFETPSCTSAWATDTSYYGGGASKIGYYITGAATGAFTVALFKAAAILAFALAIVYFLLMAFLIFSALSWFAFAALAVATKAAFFFSTDSTSAINDLSFNFFSINTSLFLANSVIEPKPSKSSRSSSSSAAATYTTAFYFCFYATLTVDSVFD